MGRPQEERERQCLSPPHKPGDLSRADQPASPKERDGFAFSCPLIPQRPEGILIMRLAPWLLISAVLHGVLLTLLDSPVEAERKRIVPIPVILLEFGAANEQGTRGDGKDQGQRRKPAGIYGSKPAAHSQGSLEDHGDRTARAVEMNQLTSLTAEQKTQASPERNEIIETVTSVGSASILRSTIEAAGKSGLSGSPLGLEEGSAGAGANGEGNSGPGKGAGKGGGGSVPGATFFQVNYADNPKPEYPDRARREGQEGTVLLRVLVDQEGRSQWVEISRSSGHAALDGAAVETVKRWRFHPARQGEGRVESRVLIPIVFRLSEAKN
jgi:TonB family protein